MGLDLIDLLEMRPASTSRNLVMIEIMKCCQEMYFKYKLSSEKVIFLFQIFNNYYAVKNPDFALINHRGALPANALTYKKRSGAEETWARRLSPCKQIMKSKYSLSNSY
jgi:hypothetical protein